MTYSSARRSRSSTRVRQPVPVAVQIGAGWPWSATTPFCEAQGLGAVRGLKWGLNGAMTSDEAIIHLADQLSRYRALTVAESVMLQGSINWARRQCAADNLRMRWHPHSDRALRRHMQAGRTDEQIAKALRRSVHSVRTRIKHLKRVDRENNRPVCDRRFRDYEVRV